MKYYQVLNMKRQKAGPSVISEKGLNELQKNPGFESKYHVVGECDASGNLLSGIASNNFISRNAETKKPETVKVEAVIKRPKENAEIKPNDLSGLDGFTDEQILQLQKIKNDTREQYRSAAESGGGTKAQVAENQGGTGTGKKRGRPKKSNS